jgi:fructokinase
MEAFALGLDLGGTKIEAVVLRERAAVDEAASIDELARVRVPTVREEGYEAVLARAVGLARTTLAQAKLSLDRVRVGVGMPGGVRRRDGAVKNSNTTCLNGRPFRQDFTRELGCPVVFDNDANAFALAETRLGAAREAAPGVVFGVILGTGVGGGVVVGGDVWPGLSGIAGEWGHHALYAGRGDARACYCGQRGCVEQYLSGPAVEAAYAARTGKRRTLAEIALARPDDEDADAVLAALTRDFGRALANVIDILDPTMVVLGGGVSNLDLLYDEGVSAVAAAVFNDELVTPIVRHALGDSAGVLGAALRALGRARPFGAPG